MSQERPIAEERPVTEERLVHSGTPPPRIPVAVQLFTVRKDCAADFPAALRRVAGIGYTHVELAGFHDLTPGELRTHLDDSGLTVVAAHVGIGELEGDAFGRTVDAYQAAGAPVLVVPYLPESRRRGAESYRRTARDLTEIGARLREHGLGLAYHNDDRETAERFDGVSALDIVVDGSDPSLVGIELDVYWALHAGLDPVAYLEGRPGRFPLLHVKDMDPADGSFTEVGAGLLPLDAILAAAPSAGVRALVVEQDTCRRPPMESVAISFNNLKAWEYA